MKNKSKEEVKIMRDVKIEQEIFSDLDNRRKALADELDDVIHTQVVSHHRLNKLLSKLWEIRMRRKP